MTETRQELQLLVVGSIKDAESKENKYPNVRIFDWLSREEGAEQNAQMDLCLTGHLNS